MKRASGVLMHIASLPGNYGIGTMGKAAYDFVDWLKSAGQKYWQILPICPTSYGDSPYQSFSTYAGNPYFIDFDILRHDGYLIESDYSTLDFGDDESKIDYELLYKNRKIVFWRAMERFVRNTPDDFRRFCVENAHWLDDYALFMAIKDAHDGLEFSKWEDNIRTREKGAVEMWRVKCSKSVMYYKVEQYFFHKQWFALKKYANKNGIEIIGDIPIYVAADSADVWANPRQFVLDGDLKPTEVAGCPPDAFSDDGQLWGNPVYDWKYMRKTKYRWWIDRLKASFRLYDIVRIDHFRGFDSYYCIKAGAKTAKDGVWRYGPGMHFWNRVSREINPKGKLPVIAEDLGFLTDSVRELLHSSGFPGMKVLQFAFDESGESDYLPFRYDKNCVVYTGTHDNDTILGWCKTAPEGDLEFAKEYLGAGDISEIPEKMMKAAIASTADTCILTMQDLLGLSSSARMNIPSTLGGNWQWRAVDGQIDDNISKRLKKCCMIYGRTEKDKTETNEITAEENDK